MATTATRACLLPRYDHRGGPGGSARWEDTVEMVREAKKTVTAEYVRSALGVRRQRRPAGSVFVVSDTRHMGLQSPVRRLRVGRAGVRRPLIAASNGHEEDAAALPIVLPSRPAMERHQVILAVVAVPDGNKKDAPEPRDRTPARPTQLKSTRCNPRWRLSDKTKRFSAAANGRPRRASRSTVDLTYRTIPTTSPSELARNAPAVVTADEGTAVFP
ncbi:hypothetical protein HU200_020384 [Digitaria exilis]|uniref:Uncharacterized protein n=1 Tax=Digitaria exilis TaxID=1010633 RepID=A0A835KDG9_9POAL|nr:hypothetical protein HU200_020384 [Digitaria exilis]